MVKNAIRLTNGLASLNLTYLLPIYANDKYILVLYHSQIYTWE
jgi:hypothetical protein